MERSKFLFTFQCAFFLSILSGCASTEERTQKSEAAEQGSESAKKEEWDAKQHRGAKVAAAMKGKQSLELPVPKDKLTDKDLDALWAMLAADDATKAYRAIWMMVAFGEQSVPYLAEHLKPRVKPDDKRLAQLIGDRATRDLAEMKDLAEPALRRALQRNPSVEMRRSITQLFQRLEMEGYSSERLRISRALEVLEQLGSSAAM